MVDQEKAGDQAEAVKELARRADASKPGDVRDRHWKKERVSAGHMAIIRSHFKSIYLIPMCILSIICLMGVSFFDTETGSRGWGLVWALSFMFYMNIFIFEWNRAWTVVQLVTFAFLIAIGFAVNSEAFPVWDKAWEFLKNLNLQFTPQSYVFFAIFFGVCATVSWVKTRLHYVVIEHNELQLYRNALFGDRERMSMLNPRIEVLVPDMIEYFHPFYRAGTVVIHAPEKTIVLENVLNIRKIEAITNRLGSSLQVRIERENTGA